MVPRLLRPPSPSSHHTRSARPRASRFMSFSAPRPPKQGRLFAVHKERCAFESTSATSLALRWCGHVRGLPVRRCAPFWLQAARSVVIPSLSSLLSRSLAHSSASSQGRPPSVGCVFAPVKTGCRTHHLARGVQSLARCVPGRVLPFTECVPLAPWTKAHEPSIMPNGAKLPTRRECPSPGENASVAGALRPRVRRTVAMRRSAEAPVVPSDMHRAPCCYKGEIHSCLLFCVAEPCCR